MQKIRALEPEHGGQIPAIALTAYASASDRHDALRAGFHRHIVKPIALAELVNAVADLKAFSAKPV
jgi:CheY-like chemotaxis protein